MPFRIDPEVQTAMAALRGGKEPPPAPAKGDYKARRQNLKVMFSNIAPARNASIVSVKEVEATAEDGHKVPCRLYRNVDSKSSITAGVLYLHGGGYIAGDLSTYDGIISRYAEKTGAPTLAVEYRLAPEHTYPKAVVDAHAALLWFFEHAEELGVDPRRIAIMGDSAGGGLTAALAHYNLQKNGPEIAKQILIYPMLDDRNIDRDPHLGMALWTAEDNETGWDCLLGGKRGSDEWPPSAVPARMRDATGLPPTYIDTGELDIFRTENLEYAAKLGKAGVSVEMHVYPGCFHAFELVAPNAAISKRALEDRYNAIRSIVPVDPTPKL